MEHSINISGFQCIQIVAILLAGLLAGLFYGYDCSVIKGFGKLADKEYLEVFQHINTTIQNPYFFLSFMGCLFVFPVCCWLSFKSGNQSAFYFILAGTLVYFVGVFGFTIMGNIPLNNLLDKLIITKSTAETLHDFRQQFEKNWNFYHHIRTFFSVLSFLLMVISLAVRK